MNQEKESQILPKIQETHQQQIELKYRQFINLKFYLEKIAHKKIVQLLFLKYSPIIINLDFEKMNLETEKQALEQISTYCLQNLSPQNSLELNLQYNNLGTNSENIKILYQGLKSQTKNLKSLNINLKQNELGYYPLNITFLTKTFNHLKNLKHLHLNLSENKLGAYSENISILFKQLQTMNNLSALHLNLQFNLFGNKPQQILIIGQSLSKLTNLKNLELNISRNFLGIFPEELNYLGECLSKLTNLKTLILDFSENTVGASSSNGLNFLKVAIKEMENLESLSINLYKTFLFNDPNIDFSPLLDSFSQLRFLKYLDLNLQRSSLGKNEKETHKFIKGLENYLNQNFLILKEIKLYLNQIYLNETEKQTIEQIKTSLSNRSIIHSISYDEEQ